MLFFALHRRRPRPVKVRAAGGLVACAILTKNIAGLIPGTGVVVYILLMRRADTKIFPRADRERLYFTYVTLTSNAAYQSTNGPSINAPIIFIVI